tara:strand:+ start:404 stop:709 length:306 start_codon:yes stop_codon:yes gene_type:complete
MENFNYQEPVAKDLLKENSHLRIMTNFLSDKKNPKVLELGVERGHSTKAFLWCLEKTNGKLFSVDDIDSFSFRERKDIRNYNPLINILYPHLRKIKKLLSF